MQRPLLVELASIARAEDLSTLAKEKGGVNPLKHLL